MYVLLRVRELQRAAQAPARALLRFLLLWHRQVSAHTSVWGGQLLRLDRQALGNGLWYALPNYSIKGKLNRTDLIPLISGVRPMFARSKLKLILLALAQTALVVAGSIGWFDHRTKAYLAGPGDGDLYAHTDGFQWAVYVLFYLPRILLINCFVLLLVYGLVRISRSWRRT